MSAMFSLIPEPLAYAQRFCARYGALSRALSTEAVAAELVDAACELSGCELIQLFCFDEHRSQLHVVAQHLDGAAQIRPAPPVDYAHEPLLRVCLTRGRSLSVTESDAAVYQTGFLPGTASRWRSLLCQPLANRDGEVAALLLCATKRPCSLDMYESSLDVLGAFAVSQMHLLQRLNPCADTLAPQTTAGDYGLIGHSAAMGRVRQLLSKVLPTLHTVLLTGETGTGKEVVARAIHESGPRRRKPFVVQNCAAFPEALLESELFGYRKGAFTGADADRPGLFDTAEGGTLLLDEIGDMPLSLQAKLLRVLQENEIRSLGSNVTRKVDVRIIAATHCDLPAMIAQGRFRADLYYRLAQFPVALPALRDREDDVVQLARHFAADAARRIARPPLQWSEAALARLAMYRFPGNVRELKGMVERAVLMCEGDLLQPDDLAIVDTSFVSPGTWTLRERLEAFERDLLLQCLRSAGGNRSLAARKLGMARRTLLYRMAHLDITPVSLAASG